MYTYKVPHWKQVLFDPLLLIAISRHCPLTLLIDKDLNVVIGCKNFATMTSLMQVYFGLDSTAVPLWNDTLSSPPLITQELRLPQKYAEEVLEKLGTIFDSSPQDIQNTWIVFGGDMDYLASKFTTAVYASELEQVVTLITGLWIYSA